MKEQIKNLIVSNIDNLPDDDIYAISLYVENECQNPSHPTVTFGYNTESQVKSETGDAENEAEARWNYAFWLQNEIFCFGCGETAETVDKWREENGFPLYDDDALFDDEVCEEAEKITKAFSNVLVEIVREIHSSKILTAKFGREIPILIHTLEYYDETARQNIDANGVELAGEFAKYCTAEI